VILLLLLLYYSSRLFPFSLIKFWLSVAVQLMRQSVSVAEQLMTQSAVVSADSLRKAILCVPHALRKNFVQSLPFFLTLEKPIVAVKYILCKYLIYYSILGVVFSLG